MNVRVSVGSHLPEVLAQNGGDIDAGGENLGRIAEMWVSCLGGLRVLQFGIPKAGLPETKP